MAQVKYQSVVVTPQAGVITLRAFPDEIREVREFLGVSQERMQRQVILEAKILEVTLSDGYQQGINWSNMTASIGNSGSVVINRPVLYRWSTSIGCDWFTFRWAN